MRSQTTNKSLFTVFCAFLLLVGAVIGSNVAVGSSQTVSGCINKKTGALRIADECSKSEKKIQWNIYGIQGEKGEQGQVGERGPQGKPGSTLLSGEGIPNAFTGEDGDFYIDLKTYTMFGPKKNDSWGVAKALTGPAGAPGVQGVKGDKGDIGAPGATGAPGAAGASGLSKAYYRLLDADLFLETDENKVVGRISDVSSGKYLVMFNTDLINFGVGQYFGCGFEAQAGGAARKIYIEPNIINGGVLLESRYNYSKNGYVAIEGGPGTIEVHCKVNGNPGPFTFSMSNGSLIALALNDVTTSFRVFPNP